MDDNLLAAYRRELATLRQLGERFAQKHPQVAGRLHLSGDVSPDPHIERLIESVAFVGAQIRRKIDQSFPEISDALLAATYPHLARTIPARSIAEIDINPDQASDQAPVLLPRGTLLDTKPVRMNELEGVGETVICRFRTVYPLELWPIELVHVDFAPIEHSVLRAEAGRGLGGTVQSVLHLRLRTLGAARFAKLRLGRLRLYLDPPGGAGGALYEALLGNLRGAIVAAPRLGVDPRAPVTAGRRLPGVRAEPVGFAADETLLPWDARAHLAYAYLQDYFSFPEKFAFVDLLGLEEATLGADKELDLLLLFSPGTRQLPDDQELSLQVRNGNVVRLHCTPIVNLFEMPAEPLTVTPDQDGQLIIPDLRRPAAYEVHAVESVSLTRRAGQFVRQPVPPLLGGHRIGAAARTGLAWHTARIEAGDEGAHLRLHLVDHALKITTPDDTVLSVTITASNRDLPLRLPLGQGGTDFIPAAGGAWVRAIRCLTRPRRPIRAGFGDDRSWRLIAHLALNRLSLADVEGLRGLLDIYNTANPQRDPHLFEQMRRQIDSVTAVRAETVQERFGPLTRRCFVHGTDYALTVDETGFLAGAYLFGTVLDRFLALYASANSFVRLRMESEQRKGPIGQWPARAGSSLLI